MSKLKWFALAAVVVAVGIFIFYRNDEPRDEFVLKNGKRLVIRPVKHTSIQIQYDGMEIEVDPVSSAVRPIVDYTDKPKADFILVTNDHQDHFDPYAVGLLAKPSTNILLPSRCFRRLSRTALRNNCVIMRNNFKADLGKGVTVYALPAYILTPGKLSHAPKSWANGYLLDFDGFRVYIAGDTELIPEMQQLKDIDIAFLPCDHLEAMDVAQFARAVRIIRPRTLYPCHFGVTGIDSIRQATEGLNVDLRIRDLR
ncbi:MAG: MBL fold metallo-hydrolase [Prevotella sp.]|nr:MBL fold metallo-hydrolase [Prevotella sp.]